MEAEIATSGGGITNVKGLVKRAGRPPIFGARASMASGWVFVTSNTNKWHEAERILGLRSRAGGARPRRSCRPRASVPSRSPKPRVAYARLGRPVIVEDAGIELAALGGFPWTFHQVLGKARRARIDLPRRRRPGPIAACAPCVRSAFCSEQGAEVVEGAIDGHALAASARQQSGFGWDAIFVPKGEGRTFGEMTAAEKDARSHRRKAWELLRERL